MTISMPPPRTILGFAPKLVKKPERARCAGIVRDRRQEIERKMLVRNLSQLEIKYIRRFLQVLTEIEGDILALPQATASIPSPIEYLGDFSQEEMERAQAIIEEQEQNIEEQEQNPFEMIEGELKQ